MKLTKLQWKRVLLILMIILFLMPPVFAAGSETLDTLNFLKNALLRIGDLASWLWILLGNFAGVLMTNTLVYAEFMGLDSFLWKVWQMMRTIANYAIWFFFLYSILKYMLVPSAKATSPLSKIKELLLASILIQASWFLVMVLVDFSTIGLATISSFPSQVIANHQPLQTTFIAELKKDQVLAEGLQKEPKAMRFNTFGDRLETTKKQLGWEKLEIDTKSLEQLEPEAFVDMLLPKPNTLSGPLTYLGFTVFKTHSFLKEYRINDANSLQALTKVLITLMFDAGMIILYAFALLILVVILVVRLVYLWVFIAASPLIFLMATTKILDLSKIASFLDWKKILSLIFQPVLFALRISVMFLVIVVLQGFFSTRQTVDFDNGSVVLKESVLTSATQTQQYRSDMTIAENVKVTLLQGTKSFQDILLGLLALAMMRYFVKLAVQTKTGISWLDKFTSNVVSTTERAIGNLPVIPTPTGEIGFKQIRDNGQSPLLERGKSSFMGRMDARDQEDIESIQELFGIEKGIAPLRTDQIQSLRSSFGKGKSIHDFPRQLQALKKENRGIRFTEIEPFVKEWINAAGSAQDGAQVQSLLKNYFGDKYVHKVLDKDATLKDILTQTSGSVAAFYKNVLWGNETVTSYDQLLGPVWNVKE